MANIPVGALLFLINAVFFYYLGSFSGQKSLRHISRGRLDPGRRPCNLAAGPSQSPVYALDYAESEMFNFGGTNAAVWELGMTSPLITSLSADALGVAGQLLDLPTSHVPFWMHGGAHAQFAAVPLNMALGPVAVRSADYVVTGFWSRRAAAEAAALGVSVRIHDITAQLSNPDVDLKAVLEALPIPSAPHQIPADAPPGAPVPLDTAYIYIAASESFDGVEIVSESLLPDAWRGYVVGDFTATLFSRPVDLTYYSALFASGGKLLGPSGVTLVIVRRDVISCTGSGPRLNNLGGGIAAEAMPHALSWQAASPRCPHIVQSLHTPPTVNIFLAYSVLRSWQLAGGLASIADRSQTRAAVVHRSIQRSDVFRVVGAAAARSRMTCVFRVECAALNSEDAAAAAVRIMDVLKAEAAGNGITGLGLPFNHSVARISLYPAIPEQHIEQALSLVMRVSQMCSNGCSNSRAISSRCAKP